MALLSLALLGLEFGQKTLADQAQLQFNASLAPVYRNMGAPFRQAQNLGGGISDLWHMRSENRDLRRQVTQLVLLQDQAEKLRIENQALRAQLHMVADPSVPFITTHVLADTGGMYGKFVLVAGPARIGDAVFDAAGLAGRITRVAGSTASAMLLTDAGSRVPVLLGRDRTHALMSGDNSQTPKLLYWAEDDMPREGDIVVTSAEGGVFPQGLPVGIVHLAAGKPVVKPAAQLRHLDIVRLMRYGNPP